MISTARHAEFLTRPPRTAFLRRFATRSLKTICNYKFMHLTLTKSVGFMAATNINSRLYTILIKTISMAEGVVSEPLLLSGDQGHKGGFAPSTGKFVQSAYHLSFAQQNGEKHPCCKARCEFGHAQKLGVWTDSSEPKIMADHSLSFGDVRVDSYHPEVTFVSW
jgi:hypothetical protein